MTWAQVMAAVETDLVAAGATLDPAILSVRQGEPDTVSVPLIAYWYEGDRESLTGGNTLTRTNLEEGIRVRIYRPGSVRAPVKDAGWEVWLREANRAVKDALWGDFTVGGTGPIGIDLDATSTTWLIVGDALCLTAEFVLWIDLAEVDTIAP